ncbi:unnamed protein product [Schistosoma curassoni]|nr:unnamed protein product [Schistosoma curassoni]
MLLPNERMTIKERKHDYLYDPLYSLSSAADHERVATKDHLDVSKMQKLFSFQNLFSEVPIYRPYIWRLNPSDPVPMSMSRYFHPVDVCKKLIQMSQLKKNKDLMIGHVFEGMDRSKYFTHHTLSLCPYPSGNPKIMDITLDSLVGNENITQIDLRPKRPVYISRYVQTMYRDSEAQTDPYSPLYVVNTGENLETLKLTSLSYGYGLPVGLFDVERIERARQRREIEANLPPYKDIANNLVQIAKRRKILEGLENLEWYFREREVEAMQEVRLNVIVQLLRRREQRKQEVISRRLDQKWSESCAQNETKCRAIKYRYIGELRKLLKLRLAAKEYKFKRDMIMDYAKPSSQVFAPLTRLGVFPDRSSERYVVKNIYSSRYEGLLTLEARLPRFAFQPRIRLQQPKLHTKDGFLKRKYRHQKELAELHDEESERQEVAVIMLQQLIRGRAIQTQMYEGKRKRSELIAESRSTHALLEDEQAQKKREKLTILAKQEDFSHLLHQVNKSSHELHEERRKRKYLNGAHREIWGPSHDASGNVSDSTGLQLKHHDTTTSTPNVWW